MLIGSIHFGDGVFLQDIKSHTVMSTESTTRKKERVTQLLETLTLDQRRILGMLQDLRLPVSELELAEKMARQPGTRTQQDRSTESIHRRLRHIELPKLADFGLISWDESDTIVTDVTGGFVEKIALTPSLAPDTERNGTTKGVGTDDFRLTVLEHLESRSGMHDLAALARRLCHHTVDGTPTPENVRQMEVRLYHIHLPRLEDEGLVEIEGGNGSVRCRRVTLPHVQR